MLRLLMRDMGRDGWKKLVDGDEGADSELYAEAWAIFTRDYKLGNAPEAIPPGAARDYLTDRDAGTLPQWIADLALYRDIRRAAARGQP